MEMYDLINYLLQENEGGLFAETRELELLLGNGGAEINLKGDKAVVLVFALHSWFESNGPFDLGEGHALTPDTLRRMALQKLAGVSLEKHEEATEEWAEAAERAHSLEWYLGFYEGLRPRLEEFAHRAANLQKYVDATIRRSTDEQQFDSSALEQAVINLGYSSLSEAAAAGEERANNGSYSGYNDLDMLIGLAWRHIPPEKAEQFVSRAQAFGYDEQSLDALMVNIPQ